MIPLAICFSFDRLWSSSVLAVHLSLTLLNWRPVDPHLAASQPMILEASCPWRPVVSHSPCSPPGWLVNSSPWSSRRLGRLVNLSPKLVAKMKKLTSADHTKYNKSWSVPDQYLLIIYNIYIYILIECVCSIQTHHTPLVLSIN